MDSTCIGFGHSVTGSELLGIISPQRSVTYMVFISTFDAYAVLTKKELQLLCQSASDSRLDYRIMRDEASKNRTMFIDDHC